MATILLLEAVRFRAFVLERMPQAAAQLPWPALEPDTPVDAHAPEALFFELWAAAARTTRDAGLPIAFGAATRLEHLGVLGAAIADASSAHDAMHRAARFQRLSSTSGLFEFTLSPARLSYTWHRPGPRCLGHRLANETVLAQHVALVRQVLGPRRPAAVSFRHAAPADVSAHRAFFDCPLHWRSARDAVDWPTETAKAPWRQAAPAAQAGLRAAEAALQSHPPTQALVSATRLEIARLLPSGSASSREVAARLSMSDRTLRRHLAARGATFRSLVDEVRKATAADAIGARALSVTELAFVLGFSEVSAFSRAYRRWFGRSVRAQRRG